MALLGTKCTRFSEISQSSVTKYCLLIKQRRRLRSWILAHWRSTDERKRKKEDKEIQDA